MVAILNLNRSTDIRHQVDKRIYELFAGFLLFATSLALSAFLILAGLGLESLIGLAIEDGTLADDVVEFVVQVSLVGSAIVVSACGAIIVAGDAIKATIEFFRHPSEDEHD